MTCKEAMVEHVERLQKHNRRAFRFIYTCWMLTAGITFLAALRFVFVENLWAFGGFAIVAALMVLIATVLEVLSTMNEAYWECIKSGAFCASCPDNPDGPCECGGSP